MIKVTLIPNKRSYYWKKMKLKLDNKTDLILKKLLKNNDSGERNLKVKRQMKNEFFRDKVFDIFIHKCDICGTDGTKPYIIKKGKEKNNPLVIHHKKYDWKYPYEKDVRINCKDCFIEQPKEIYKECLNNCVLLCDMCHYKLHTKLQRETGSWIEK